MDNKISMQLAELGRRLRAARTARDLNQKDFGALGGVSITTQQQYEAGKNAPSAEYLFKLANAGVNVRHVVFGSDDFGSIAHLAAAELISGGITRPDQSSSIDAELDLVQVQEIDLAYGLGGQFSDGPVEVRTHHFPREWVRSITATPASMLTIARGRGDSMQPTIQDGDMVIIDRSQRTIREQDAMWALTIGDFAMIKRVRSRGERIQILSDNTLVPMDEAHHEEINVVGRVIFVGRRV